MNTGSNELSNIDRQDATSAAEADQGVGIMEEILRSWSSTIREDEASQDMVIDGPGNTEEQLSELRQCMETFKPLIEQNGWLKSVISSL